MDDLAVSQDHPVRVIRASWGDLNPIHTLLAADAEEQARSRAAAVLGFDDALSHFDFLRSDSFWLLIGYYEGRPAGWLSAARIPKGDSRKAFIFVDELWVLQVYRRRGVATALLNEITAVGREIGAYGIRLIARPENDAALAFYQRLGFGIQESVICQKEW